MNVHCKFLLLEYAFETLGMERVEFRADNDNKRSIAAMKSIGCTVEGVLRSNGPRPDGTRRDSIVLSILRGEWFASVRKDFRPPQTATKRTMNQDARLNSKKTLRASRKL